jgi:hypothetical protein
MNQRRPPLRLEEDEGRNECDWGGNGNENGIIKKCKLD